MENVYNPVSTYRIQFHKDFSFNDLEKIIPYLQRLGVRTIYASPIFEAVPGSQHGYDGTNPNRINPEIGTEEQLRRISAQLKENNIGWIQDIVPNHLAFDEHNPWLMDVLEKGQSSAYASYFDIDWQHPAYPGRLMVPFPGSELEKILHDKFPGEKNYAVCDWRETDSTINYRRFFLVNGLICTNIHDDQVFSAYHTLVKKLVDDGIFQGIRIDHVDGLYDPTKYLNDLRKLCGIKTYIIVEKILEPEEQMPDRWPIQGNSGYDFLGIVNNLLTNRESEYALVSFYYDLTGNAASIRDQIKNKKTDILNQHMQGELDNLTRLYFSLSDDSSQDTGKVKAAIAAYLVDCPVYRYYDDDFPIMEMDQGKDRNKLSKFYKRCMQFTGPLMAKGVEDTLMYTYNMFVSHNEVGDSPEFFGYTPAEFHALMQERMMKWPYSLNASSTHDTKRGEDVRARLNALTGLYEEWIPLVSRWMLDNRDLKTDGAPDKNDEYFIYQTLVGSYPLPSEEQDIRLYPQRLSDYLQKFLREAKVHSGWTEPNEQYESATISFAKKLIDKDSKFRESFIPFLEKVAYYGMIHSFSQLVLKFTCPGIPDVYQGCELWDLSLVDPDNRRPVDYAVRMRMLDNRETPDQLWRTRHNGNIKLSLLHRLQIIRNRYNDVFADGEYIPVEISGTCKKHALAFIRRNRHSSILVVIPLNFAGIHTYAGGNEMPRPDWHDTALEISDGVTGGWEDLLNGGTVRSLNLADIFAGFPVAVLKS